jgi:hypothetical protein
MYHSFWVKFKEMTQNSEHYPIKTCGDNMADNPDLTLINTTPLSDLPDQSLEDFKAWVLNEGLQPSVALRKLIYKYNVQNPGSSLPIRLVELTYPDIDISKCDFNFKVTDSGYPNSDLDQYSDSDFDEAVKELRKIELGW